jgi:hypothetical protein
MLLHLGGDQAVRITDVEALLDFRLFSRTPANREFLALARSQGRLLTVRGAAAETVVLTRGSVWLSPLSRSALRGRAVSAQMPSGSRGRGGGPGPHEALPKGTGAPAVTVATHRPRERALGLTAERPPARVKKGPQAGESTLLGETNWVGDGPGGPVEGGQALLCRPQRRTPS